MHADWLCTCCFLARSGCILTSTRAAFLPLSCSLAGDFNSALQVRQRMRQLQVTPSVHVFNALIAACERAGHYEMGLQLRKEMLDAGQAPNTTTMQLMHQIGDKGVAYIERQQTAMAALSAAVAAAGAYMVRTGLF